MDHWKVTAVAAITFLDGGGVQLAWAQAQPENPDVVAGASITALGGGTTESRYVALLMNYGGTVNLSSTGAITGCDFFCTGTPNQLTVSTANVFNTNADQGFDSEVIY